jgi:hypothetical protein
VSHPRRNEEKRGVLTHAGGDTRSTEGSSAVFHGGERQ